MEANAAAEDGARPVLAAGLPAGATAALAGRAPGAGEVRAEADLAGARAALGARRWALLLVDHGLPGGGGAALVRELRATPGGGAVPVLYCVPPEVPAEEAHRLVAELGIARLLFRPLDPDRVAREVAAALGGRPDAPAPAGGARGDLATAVAGIWEKFRGATLARVDRLEEAAVALLAGELDAGLRREAEREAHKLAGAVGTFGFSRGSEIARAVELMLEGTRPLAPADALELSEAVNALREELEAPRPPAPTPAAPAAPEPDRPLLWLVTHDADLAARVTMEAEGRGFRTRRYADVDAARGDAGATAPRAAVVALPTGPGRAAALALVEGLAARVPSVPVVAVSDRDTFADRVEAARSGARTFLRTPVAPGRVVDALAQDLARGHAAGATVLVVDDDPHVLTMLELLLETRGVRMVAVDDPGAFWARLEATHPDLVVLDQDMPGVRGVELCRVLRGDPRWSDLPVLFLTGNADPATVHRIFDAGADDYVRKPMVGPELLTRIASRLEQARLRAAEDDHAAPGGIAPRPRAAAETDRLLQIAGRQGDPLALGLIDLDGFRRVNERVGRAAADEILARMAVVLQGHLRGGDLVGSWDGDEFVVALYGAERDLGVQRLSEILRTVRQEPVPHGTEVLHLSFSAGVAEFPVDGADLPRLAAAAETALRAAKAAGGGRVLAAGAARERRAAEVVDVALVEDDPILTELLVHALGVQGYRVRAIDDGERAVERLAGPDPDLRARVLLLDVDLPGRDGLGVLRELARSGVVDRTHVVMLTVRSTEQEVLEALEMGAADHVAKPFSVPILLQRIRGVLRRKHR